PDAHKINDRAPPSDPIVSTVPLFDIATVPVALAEADPRVLGFDQPPTYGITFTNARRVVRTEGWTVTFEGRVPEAAPTRGHMLPGDILTNFDVRFTDLVTYTGEKSVQDGDLVVFLDDPTPAPNVNCSQI